jgi:U3 small nucleolar ribonucleoprotein protein IMP4
MSLRREVRLRKEFLLKKEHELKESQTASKKRQLAEAIAEGNYPIVAKREYSYNMTLLFVGTSIPTEIRADARRLQHAAELDINKEDGDLDDEYASAAHREPKICVTTSRDPSSRLKQFAK